MKSNLFLTVAMMAMLTACGAGTGPTTDTDTTTKSFSVNGVKLISPNIKKGTDKRTYKQMRYVVGAEDRLLLRFEALRSSQSKIYLADKNDLFMRITAVNASEKQFVIDNVKLCPITRSDWMLAASWAFAHPFHGAGKWAQEGGDYDPAGCVTGQDDYDSDPNNDTGVDAQAVYYKITRWYRDYMLGRGKNNGHILINNSANVEIFGDESSSYSPQILWNEKVVAKFN